MNFSKNISAVKLSPIVKITEMVRERSGAYKQETGEDFVFFQRGEIGFKTPSYIVNAVTKALEEGHTRYPKSGGELVLRSAIARKLERLNGASGLGPENVLVTYGGTEALQISFKLFEGKKGAGFGPCWTSILLNIVPINDIEFKLLPLNTDFSINWIELENTLKQVDFFYLNNPQNPTGKVFSKEEVMRISELCEKHGAYLISDEAYERIVYDGREHFSAASIKKPHIISCFTFSKAYAMTGWRIGYVVCHDPATIAVAKLGEHSQTAGVVTFIQHAAAYALDSVEEEQAAFWSMMKSYQERRNLIYDQLKNIPGVKLNRPEGAFYLFPDFSELIPKGLSRDAHQKYIFELLLSHGVAVVYGACFGSGFDNHVRISFSATDLGQISSGTQRIQQAIHFLREQAA